MSKTRLFSLLLVLVMVLGSTIMAFAAEGDTTPSDAWKGEVATAFESGTGSANDPFIIKNGAQLAYMRDLVNAGKAFFDGFALA